MVGFTSNKEQNVPRRSLYRPLHFKGQRSRMQKFLNHFSAVIPPHLVKLTSSTAQNVPIPGADMLALPRTTDFLVKIGLHIIKIK